VPPTRSTRYVLDTQFYVDILRGDPTAAATIRFLATHVAAVDLPALVGAELLIGAVDAAAATAIRQRLVDRFKPARVLVPDADDLLAAGDALRALRDRDGVHPEHERRNFWNDVLIAPARASAHLAGPRPHAHHVGSTTPRAHDAAHERLTVRRRTRRAVRAAAR
jgi:predicted nucleic acid-binding protein